MKENKNEELKAGGKCNKIESKIRLTRTMKKMIHHGLLLLQSHMNESCH